MNILSFPHPELSIGYRVVDPWIAMTLNKYSSKRTGQELAQFVQQIHYMISQGLGRVVDGTRWVYNSLRSWQESMPDFSFWTIRTALEELRELGVIEYKQLDSNKHDKKGWYRVNTAVLEQMVAEHQKTYLATVATHNTKNVNNGATNQAAHPRESTPHIHVRVRRTSTCGMLSRPSKNSSKNSNKTAEQPAAAAISDEPCVCVLPYRPAHTVTPPSLLSTDDIGLTHHGLVNPTNHTEMQGARDNNLQDTANIVEARDKSKAESDERKLQEQQEQQSKIEAIASADIEVSPQLRSMVREYLVDEVLKAVEYYNKSKTRKTIKKPTGWIVDCLTGKWWKSEEKSTQQPSAPKQEQSQPIVVAPEAPVSVIEVQQEGETLDSKQREVRDILMAIFKAVQNPRNKSASHFEVVELTDDFIRLNSANIFPGTSDRYATVSDLLKYKRLFPLLKEKMNFCWDECIRLAREANPDMRLPSLLSGEYI